MTNKENANSAYRQILSDILSIGKEIKASKTLSTGSEKITKDLWNYSVKINNPNDSIVKSDEQKFFLAGAVSRFIWMMGANNRIKDIEFYWGSGVGRFSDDEILMPGSNYGARMITPRPGMNQIESVIDRLKKNPSTRRGAISIYHPEDAVRDSKDIPCAFGIFYTIRDGKLNTTIIMRSNNAKFLFPYNIFEFSLLSEVIANEVGVEIGELHFQAVSMHLYEEDFEKAQKIVDETEFKDFTFSNPIPKNNNSLNEIKKLIKLEADLRHASMGLTKDNVQTWIEQAKNDLHQYWVQFFLIILHYVAEKKLYDIELTQIIYEQINDTWKQFIAVPANTSTKTKITDDLFGKSTTRVVELNSQYKNELNQLDKSCLEVNKSLLQKNKKVMTIDEYIKIKDKSINVDAIAARDGQLISPSQVDEILNEIRK